MSDIVFAKPGFFYLFIAFIPLIAWYIYSSARNSASLQVSSTKYFKNDSYSILALLRHSLFVLRILALSFIILALARPRISNRLKDISTEGIDIVLSLDISGSMQAMDLKPDRITAAKNVASEFVAGRPNDRLGLVVFGGQSFTKCPLTTHHPTLINMFDEINVGLIEDEGTAIGSGLGTAVNRLKDSKAISKVVILLTDGMNNAGAIQPLDAAAIAKLYGIRVYTIGVGARGKAPYPARDFFGRRDVVMVDVDIDEETLTAIANKTGGKYFRAVNNQKLVEIYQEIDKLEKTKIEEREKVLYDEYFYFFIAFALGLLFIEILAKNTLFKNIP